MNPNELRALADALHWVQYTADWQTCDRAADYLRAQAEAQPVAWMWQHDETGRIGFVDQYQVEAGWQELNPRCELVQKLYAHPAPAVPQAEPKREPLTYEQLVSACYTYRHDFGLLDPDEQHLVIEEAGRWAKAFGIGGSDAE